MGTLTKASEEVSKKDLSDAKADIAEVERDVSACREFFENDYLLWIILSNLSQGELLRLQCVSRRWMALSESSYELCSRVFRPQSLATNDEGTVLSHELNTFVSDRIRWTPAMNVDQVNSSDFKSVRESACLGSMAVPGASWRTQLICWPAIFDITISSGVGEEEGAPLLQITCPRPAVSLTAGGGIRDAKIEVPKIGEEEEVGEVMKLNIQDFPHNEGKGVNGITFEDVLFAMRQQYIENDLAFEAVYEYLDLEADAGGEWVIGFADRDESGIPNLEVSILLF